MSILVDSFTNAWQSSAMYNKYIIAVGQTFSNNLDNDARLVSAQFSLWREGSPTGNVYAALYNLTGTFGTNAKPTGEAIAISDNVDITTIPNTQVPVLWTSFSFSGDNQVVLEKNGQYGITCVFNGGDSNNKLYIRGDQYDSGYEHDDGNGFSSSNLSTWWGSDDHDRGFKVYGNEIILTPVVGQKYALPPFRRS